MGKALSRGNSVWAVWQYPKKRQCLFNSSKYVLQWMENDDLTFTDPLYLRPPFDPQAKSKHLRLRLINYIFTLYSNIVIRPKPYW